MAEQLQSQSPNGTNSQVPSPSPTQPRGDQQGASSSLPISPYTGQPYNPEWGILLKKGIDGQQPIQQIMQSQIERKADQ